MLRPRFNWTVILFLSTIALVFFLPHADTDFGWHYRCGKLLLHGNPCLDNKFTYFLADYKWAYPSFLYDAIIAITYNIKGFIALSILGSIIFTAVVYVLYKNIRGPDYLKIILISSALYLSWGILHAGLRSQVISLLFLVITISLILNSLDKPKKSIWILPPLFLIWANTHAGFILGLTVISIYALHLIFSRFKKEIDNEHFIKSVSIYIFSICATLINPFTYRIYEELYRHFKTPLNTTIAEWVPTNMLLSILIVFLVIAYFIYTTSSKKLNVFKSLLIVAFAVIALLARRNIPVFFLSFIVVLDIPAPDAKKLKPVISIALFSAFLFLGINNVYKTIVQNQPSTLCEAKFLERYPCKETEYFRDRTGTVFNTYEWGGYLIWKIPNMKIFIDGRMPAWSTPNGVDSYTYWLEILQTKEGWDKKLDDLGTNYLFIGSGTLMDLLLKDDPEKYGYEEVLRGNAGQFRRTT